MEINEHIKNRWSPRAFSKKEVEQEKLKLLFEAARWAPSSMNEQPWRFIYARKGDEGYQKIFDSLADGNKEWAGLAPVLMVVVTKNKFAYKNRPNKHSWYDAGQAMANLSIQATESGLHLHQMAGFDQARIERSFGLNDDYEAIAVAAIGYLGEPSLLNEKYRELEKKERKRRPLEDTVFYNEWKGN